MYSAEDRPDLRILDSEPWNEADQPVDRLIVLQRQAFRADRRGNYQQFGTVLMSMAQIEHDIENHIEAAAYATEAAEAFEKAGTSDDAIAAHATVAREYRTLFNPDLSLASLRDVIAVANGSSANTRALTKPEKLDMDALPSLRLAANIVATFTGTIFNDDEVSYPPVLFDKYPKPSKSTASEFLFSLTQFSDMPLEMTGKEASDVLLYLSAVYSLISHRRFGLRGMDKTESKFMATAIGRLSFSLRMRPDSRNATMLAGGKKTINSLVSSRNLRDLDFF